jgi:hypothetical protein
MHDIFSNRHYIIFDTAETGSIDFSQVFETSHETLRFSTSSVRTFVKYDGDTMPSSVVSLTTKEGPYSHDEILNILTGSEWTPSGSIA